MTVRFPGQAPPDPADRLPAAGLAPACVQTFVCRSPSASPFGFAVDLGIELSEDCSCLPRKEVIQPHLPIRLPCYDFTPVIDLTFGGGLLAVTIPTSGALNSHGVTGGVYKARERIHRGILIRDY